MISLPFSAYPTFSRPVSRSPSFLTLISLRYNYILRVDFVSGSRLLLDMKPYLDKLRFRPLADPAVWNSAVTNGIFVRFDNVELSHDEILSMAERAH